MCIKISIILACLIPHSCQNHWGEKAKSLAFMSSVSFQIQVFMYRGQMAVFMKLTVRVIFNITVALDDVGFSYVFYVI